MRQLVYHIYHIYMYTVRSGADLVDLLAITSVVAVSLGCSIFVRTHGYFPGLHLQQNIGETVRNDTN